MKKMFKSTVALITGAAMTFGTAVSLTANADDEYSPGFGPMIIGGEEFVAPLDWSWDSISFRILESGSYASTVYVNSDDLKDSDYTIQAGIFLEGDYNEFADMWHFRARWDTFDDEGIKTKYIQSKNVETYGYQWNDEKTNMFLKPLTDALYPYDYRDGTLYAEEPYKVKWVHEKTGEEKIYDVVLDERTGTASGVITDEVEFRIYNGFKIAHYNPDTPKGVAFCPEHRYAGIDCLSSRKNAWINKVTGDNMMAKFDVVIDKNTPNGTYYIAFDNLKEGDYNFMSNAGRKLFPSNAYFVRDPNNTEHTVYNNDKNYWLKIVVGEPSEEEPEYDVNHDGAIDISDATKVLMEYAENAVKSETDIPILKSAFESADVNGDGEVNIEDASYILKYYAESAAGLR